MATSPTHKFGQIIGEVIEKCLHSPLAEVAKRHGLYLDWKRPRPARGNKSKVAWVDFKGNSHDLDYVLEAGGSDAKQGRPKAFIEIAYRRYTKHSRNKAQEMQGAIGPLSEAYKHDHPFLGAVLAGIFTQGSVVQLRSHGFAVLYFPFESIARAFATVGIDANFDESSDDVDVQEKVDTYERLTKDQIEKLKGTLCSLHSDQIAAFVKELEVSLTRTIASIFVLALHGKSSEVTNVDDAIKLVEQYDETPPRDGFVRYEVNVRYSNGDEMRGTFTAKTEAVRFLNSIR